MEQESPRIQFRFVRCAITADTIYDPVHRLRPVLFLLHGPVRQLNAEHLPPNRAVLQGPPGYEKAVMK